MGYGYGYRIALGRKSIFVQASQPPAPFIIEVVISGFTGNYLNANGTYTREEMNGSFNNYNGFYMFDNEIYSTATDELIGSVNYSVGSAVNPSQYLTSITLSGAGTGDVDGIYTRADTVDGFADPFNGPLGTISYDYELERWITIEDYYRTNIDFTFGWVPVNGELPSPTQSLGYSARQLGSPVVTSVVLSA